jgi:two-component system NtrC family sensor kinase
MKELAPPGGIITDEWLEMVVVVSDDYRISYASPRFAQLLGLNAGEVTGKLCYQLLQRRESPCEDISPACPVSQVLHSGKACEGAHRCFQGQQTEGSYAIDCYPVRDKDGRAVQAISVVKSPGADPGRQKALGKMYRLAGMGELLDGVAHNLNTPLSAVVARAEMLGDRLRGLKQEMPQGKAAGDDAFVAKLDKSIRDAEVIVANALKLSDSIKNMMNKRLHEEEDTPQMISLNHLIKEELQFLEADMVFKHEITKACVLDESLPAVRGVYHHFSQSIIEIVRNILDSFNGSDRKELTITTRRDERAIHVEFSYTGLDRGQPCQTSDAMRLANVSALLQPYGAVLTVIRRPHDNRYTITIPCGGSGR